MTGGKLSRRRLLATGGLGVAAAGLAAPPVLSSEPIRWRMQSHWTPGQWYFDSVYREFGRWVMEATAGEIQIEMLQADSLVPSGEVLGAVRRGLLNAAFIFPGYWVGRLPVAGHLNGNLATWDNHEEMQFFFYEMGALEIIREAYAQMGVYQAGPMSFAGIAVFAKKPIETRADFQGFQIRSTGTPARVFERMGATPVSIPGGELYQALRTGVVEGAHWGAVATGWGMNLQEVTSHIVTPDFLSHSNGEFMVSMNDWNRLGEDHKRVIETAVRAMSAKASAHFRHRDFLHMEEFTGPMGKHVSRVSDDVVAEMRQHSLAVVDEFSAQDPQYCGRVGAILHEFMRLTGKV